MAAVTDVSCTCTSCARVRATIDKIHCVLDIYGWLLNSYVVDFFQEDLWKRLPEGWRLVLQDTLPQEFGAWLSGDISCTRVWPLSLLALRKVTYILQINRNHEDSKNVVSCCKFKKTNGMDSKKTQKAQVEHEPDSLNLCFDKFSKLFSKHIKKKKRYEIEAIAEVCINCASQSDCRCIVDIGAGMGHLARLLAFRYGLCIACIDQDHSLTQEASKCDRELLVSIQKQLPNFCGKHPQHITSKLEPSNLGQTELIHDLQDTFKNNFCLNGEETKFGLVGLHPCGDLAPILLKLYSLRHEAKFICIVGCCYMKLNLKHEMSSVKGYPLSKYVSLFERHELSYNALEVACHAIEKYCDKLKTGNYEDLIVHAYRAILETILITKDVKLRHSQVKNVKVTKGMTLEQYCSAATTHLETQLQPQSSDFDGLQIQCFLNRWQQVIIFGSLRMMLAPLVETIILLDRFLFLSEKNFAPMLKPVFDARLSPRNLVLISVKDN